MSLRDIFKKIGRPPKAVAEKPEKPEKSDHTSFGLQLKAKFEKRVAEEKSIAGQYKKEIKDIYRTRVQEVLENIVDQYEKILKDAATDIVDYDGTLSGYIGSSQLKITVPVTNLTYVTEGIMGFKDPIASDQIIRVSPELNAMFIDMGYNWRNRAADEAVDELFREFYSEEDAEIIMHAEDHAEDDTFTESITFDVWNFFGKDGRPKLKALRDLEDEMDVHLTKTKTDFGTKILVTVG